MVYTNTPSKVPNVDLNPTQLFEEIGCDRILFQSLVETAVQDLPGYLEKVQEAASQKDFLGVQQFSHAMKTTLAHWQAKEAHDLVLSIELLCRAGKGAEALTLLPKLELAILKVVHALQALETRL